VTFKHGVTAIFLDPPYADTANRNKTLYRLDSESVAHAVREWAIEQGGNPLLRICLAGYEGEHQMPNDWQVFAWNAGAGFGGQAKEQTGNGKRERLWFSPACLNELTYEKRRINPNPIDTPISAAIPTAVQSCFAGAFQMGDAG
jgi:hypothetical protein